MRVAYETIHKNEKRFHGYSILDHVPAIAELVFQTEAKKLLDYGCGKGYQYLVARVHESWGGILPYCYDIGIPRMSDGRSHGPFDGVICTDVLEHVEETAVDDVLRDIFRLADRFVFLTISCSPARHKTLPDGRNVHVTVKPPEWWGEKITAVKRWDGTQIVTKVVYEDVL